MVCDHCDYKVCHFKCAGFSAVPQTNWFCKYCLERRPGLANMLNVRLGYEEEEPIDVGNVSPTVIAEQAQIAVEISRQRNRSR